jgi:hypothetical protein
MLEREGGIRLIDSKFEGEKKNKEKYLLKW